MQDRRYFARVTAGLERVAWEDIERRTGARLESFGHRRIDFRYDGPPAALLDLRGVDDVYVFAARPAGLDHTRASLARLTRKIAEVDFGPALDLVAAARDLPAAPSYRVTASHLGRRNYSRYDVEGAAAEALAGRLPWRFVPNAPEEVEPDLDLRVLLEDDWALLGLRLGDTPLHRRAYKIASQPGSLKPPVAYCLGLLAGLAPGAVVLDPACGAGTILAEAAELAPGGVLVGGDAAETALALAQANLEAAGLAARVVAGADLEREVRAATGGSATHALLYQGDVAALALEAGLFDAVIANLPWGQQVSAEADLAALYREFLRLIERALKPGGRAVLLTDQAGILSAVLEGYAGLRLAASLQISLFGRHPTVYTFERE